MHAPLPTLRRLWVGASAAGHVMERIRTLEEAWEPLFASTYELALLNEDELTRPLFDALGIDATLAVALERPPLKDRTLTEGRPRRPVRWSESSHAPAPLSGATTVGATFSHPRHEFEGVETDAERVLVSGALPISRADASLRLDEIFERAGLRSAWREQVVSTSGDESGVRLKLNAPASETVAPGDAPASGRRAVPREISPVAGQSVQGNLFPSPQPAVSNVLVHTSTLSELDVRSSSRQAHAGFSKGDAARSEDRLSLMLLPLIERLDRSHTPRQSRPVRAPKLDGGVMRPGTQDLDSSFTRPDPPTGLQRLVAAAPHAPARYARGIDLTPDDNGRELSLAPEPFVSSPARDESGDFGSQLAELLRRESLRFGIDIEEA